MDWRGVALLPLALIVGAPQTPPALVRVVIARVDVHADASDASAVIGGLQYGEVLPVLDVDHGWDHVRVFVSGSRVEAYVPASATAPAPPDASVNAPMRLPTSGRIVGRGDPTKPSVALDVAGRTTWIEAAPLRAVPVVTGATGLSPLASSPEMELAIAGLTPMPSDASVPVTWTWILPASATKVSATKTPVLSAFFTNLQGLAADQVFPLLVRLAPAGAEWRAVSGARGRADMPFHDEADWAVMSGLIEDRVAGQYPDGGSGLMKIRLDRPLTPGEYAVVLRFAGPRRVAGSAIFGGAALAAGESIVFNIAWPFRVM